MPISAQRKRSKFSFSKKNLVAKQPRTISIVKLPPPDGKNFHWRTPRQRPLKSESRGGYFPFRCFPAERIHAGDANFLPFVDIQQSELVDTTIHGKYSANVADKSPSAPRYKHNATKRPSKNLHCAVLFYRIENLRKAVNSHFSNNRPVLLMIVSSSNGASSADTSFMISLCLILSCLLNFTASFTRSIMLICSLSL